MKDVVLLGHISAAHGIKGWLKIYSYCQPRENIFAYQPWLLIGDAGEQKTVRLLNGQKNGKTLIAQLEGCEDRNSAETWIGCQVFVQEDKLPKLEQNEFYWRELLGLDVINSQQCRLGKVSGFMETGANDVLVVRPEPDDSYTGDRLIPFVMEQVILSVDLSQRLIVVAWDADF